MPYKDKTEQKEAQARHYQANKSLYQARTKARADRNRTWLNEHKSKSCCEDCGMNNPWCLDFHHKDGKEKRATVSDMAQTGYGLETLIAEVAKCICLCANCHRIRHKGNVWECDSRAGGATG